MVEQKVRIGVNSKLHIIVILLFMGVMTIVRFEETFRIFFDKLIANAKQITQTQIAVMRKMSRIP